MNIKISIKDCQCIQGITTNKQFSQIEYKKKTMLYAPPQSDKNRRQTIRQPPRSNQNSKKTQNVLNTNSKQYRQSQQQMLNQLKKNGTNRATVDMVQNSNMILQKQNQILEQNQRTIQHMVNNNSRTQQMDGQAIRNQVMSALDQIQNQVVQIKKMRNQIASATQDLNRNLGQLKNGKNPKPQLSNHIYDLNANMKNLVQVSQNHLEGLQNMEAIKSLQNFNIEGYNQAINTLKKQIAQYQKQSQNIQRQLKIRTAKLQKLELPPKFQEQLYRPYQQHLNNRIKNIDLHAIKERIYDKIGGFDYGKFQVDLGNIMIQARDQLSNFNIICKEHAIVVPDIRIDQKQLKNLDIKLPSVLDEYKAARGIKFDDPKKPAKQVEQQNQYRPSMTGGLSKTNQLQARLKQTNNKKPTNLRQITTKPVDLAHQIQLTKQSDKRPTILQNQSKKQKKQLQQRIKKSSKEKKKQDEQFEKYLENRARQQLQILYKQQKERLQKMQNQLYDEVQNPVYIDLNLKRQQVQARKQSPKKQLEQKKQKPKQQQKDQYQQQFQQFQNQQSKKQKQIIQEQPNKNIKNSDIKEIGRDILKEKLKNLLGDKNKQTHITHPNNFMPRRQQNVDVAGERQVQNIAEGFLAMINNTLTQVNNNLAKSIQKKIELNQDRRPTSLQRKQAKKIQVPKLEAFRPPPVFNVNLVQQPGLIAYMPGPPQNIPQQQKKIVVQSYDQYKLQNDDNYDEYQISSQQDDEA